MKLWIDTEFNDFGGALISLAIVDENGRTWYECLACEAPSEWVAQHVMPVLRLSPISRAKFTASLQRFLSAYDQIHVVADWPEDIAHFCRVLITGPGQRIDTPPTTLQIRRDLTSLQSAIPHNALADAIALKEMAQAHDRRRAS